MKKEIKEALLSVCRQYVQERMATATQAIASANDAAVDDTKSSAGDKFETTREMMQQEISRHRQLLADAQQMEQVLTNIDIHHHAGPARLGSLVETNNGRFFLAISAGQLDVQGTTYFAISAASPIGQLILGKAPGQQFVFNRIDYQILDVS